MTLSRDAFAALGFLAFSLAYGWQTQQIEMFAWQAAEPFTPRTYPTLLAGVGVVLSVIQLIKALSRTQEVEESSWRGFDWGRVALLVVAMVVYGAIFTPVGFLVSTALFLAAGYYILGERRWLVVLGASVVVSVGFWAIMTQLLGLYLAPGFLFNG